MLNKVVRISGRLGGSDVGDICMVSGLSVFQSCILLMESILTE